ncbi:hypothetical protein [Marinimicrobium sp. ARAG 43.8]|uniref:hypothetical protein n=1 Tax=Marinimicrobium sp. ARAG 43.8 TaxID=3418719 RepID=UPI003CEB1F5F
MYRLTFTGDTVTGFRRQEAIDNLARLLEMSPEQTEAELFSPGSVDFKVVDTKEEADQWRHAFGEAGALLIVLPEGENTPGGSRFAGADPASTSIEEPTPASVMARLPAVRRRNRAFMILGALGGLLALLLIVIAWLSR